MTTLMAQYMCWPLSTSCRKRYETEIDTKVSVSPLERMDQEKCHRHTLLSMMAALRIKIRIFLVYYVFKYVFLVYVYIHAKGKYHRRAWF